mmetsp:Transcript_22243/g.71671  ORF Transcript_22243/g.71671 Transcript_22243/m.71671 type:complete len:390 (-) Transcript_22243:55-1224(-)
MGVAALLRVSFVTAVFFFAMAAIGHAFPEFHDKWWGAKFWGWGLGLLAAWFVPNGLFFGYIWVARVGAFIFIILQQVLLIDLAYYVNDAFVTMADQGAIDTLVCGLPWPLLVLLLIAGLCFAVAIAGIALLFTYFGTRCESPNVILSLTIILVVIAVLCQLFVSKDSNLLTSSFISVYAVYLALAALSANPVARCNPLYSKDSDALSIVLGMTFTVLVLLYTIYSATYQVQYLQNGRGGGGGASQKEPTRTADNAPGGALMNRILTGSLPEGTTPADAKVQAAANNGGDPEAGGGGGGYGAASPEDDDPPVAAKSSAEVASFNIVLGLMAMQVAMITTDFGSTRRGGRLSSPASGKVAVFIQAAAQWTALALYIWTCVAPTLFPDRDFS